MREGRLSIACVHYGAQSGVTSAVAPALLDRGHDVRLVAATGELEPRDPVTRRRRPTPAVLVHRALAALKFGRSALVHRWNTTYAFDRHSLGAGAALAAIRPEPELVLQNGALFSPVRDYGVDPGRVAVLGAGANVFPDRALRRDDGRTILFVLKDFARKGGPVLLDAFARVRHARPKARLLVAGSGAPGRSPIPAGVFLLGRVSVAEVASLLAHATVFALPTLREPFGIAFLDAMACGVPCVGTRIEAVPEIVREGETGLLVPPGDPVALALALEPLLGDPGLARTTGARGRARVFAGGLWSHVGARLERALLGVLPRPVRAA